MLKTQKNLLILNLENYIHMNNNTTEPQIDGHLCKSDLSKIHNIVFDLGGVVINLKRERAVEAFKELGLKDADRMLGLYRQEEPFLGIETGRLHAGEFFELIRISCPDASDLQITEAFNKFLVDIPVERLQRLRKLRESGLKLFVLSNTNPIMYNSWIAEHFRQEGLSINDYFDGIVTSFQELCCKPDLQIFRTVLRRYDLDPESTLMLDDSSANCEAAKHAGMKACQVGNAADNDMLALTRCFIEK